jgi:hypothetical protein
MLYCVDYIVDFIISLDYNFDVIIGWLDDNVIISWLDDNIIIAGWMIMLSLAGWTINR